MIEPFAEAELKPHPFNVKDADKYVWCVFCYHSVSGNDQDYDVLKGIFDSEEKAIAYMKELEKINKSFYKSFDVEKMVVK